MAPGYSIANTYPSYVSFIWIKSFDVLQDTYKNSSKFLTLSNKGLTTSFVKDTVLFNFLDNMSYSYNVAFSLFSLCKANNLPASAAFSFETEKVFDSGIG